MVKSGTARRSGAIDRMRREIDRIDRKIVRLLERRARKALRIGAEKRDAGVAIHIPERETAVLARAVRGLDGVLTPEEILEVISEIIRVCRQAETRA